MKFTLLSIITILISLSPSPKANGNSYELKNDVKNTQTDTSNTEQGIITLSPHLTEVVYALNKQHKLLAVSDFSDYPMEASQFPSVASFQGVNIAEVLRLSPTHVLAWKDGNKQQDIDKLRSLGFSVLFSSPSNVDDLASNILQISDFIDAESGKELANNIEQSLKDIEHMSVVLKPLTAVFVMGLQPLSGAGSDDWINSALAKCKITNIYENGLSSYLQLSMADIIRQSPDIVIVAGEPDTNTLNSLFSKHNAVFSPHFVHVNPDTFFRFTPRIVNDIKKLCANRQSF